MSSLSSCFFMASPPLITLHYHTMVHIHPWSSYFQTYSKSHHVPQKITLSTVILLPLSASQNTRLIWAFSLPSDASWKSPLSWLSRHLQDIYRAIVHAMERFAHSFPFSFPQLWVCLPLLLLLSFMHQIIVHKTKANLPLVKRLCGLMI